ncbi:hypothetical protein [Neorhodopirellula pilleata]|uniref:Uncharacterized protein n=1 Tax=Neorhodopirellula pilleata TaxID=2714738 RepID=A0A5C6AHE3_9BACT|nr:hypothetical protein [Neorhodopirellula pilleata]TWT98836.1 hypothetical protein Pla100_20020 [Neorhodopirellula pilleata]
MDRFLQFGRVYMGLARVFMGLAWITVVGCGGSEPSVAPTTGMAPTTTTAPDSGVSESSSDVPAKELKNGMTLPDEVPLEPSASSTTGPDSSKGLQLPDDLSPSL